MMKDQRRDLKNTERGFVKVTTFFYIFSDKNRGAKLFILLLLFPNGGTVKIQRGRHTKQ